MLHSIHYGWFSLATCQAIVKHININFVLGALKINLYITFSAMLCKENQSRASPNILPNSISCAGFGGANDNIRTKAVKHRN